MTKTLLFLICITLSSVLFAQDTEGTQNTNEVEKCGQFEALEKMRIEDPIYYQIYQLSRATIEKETIPFAQKSGIVYTVPVVFHVLHDNGPENITDQQIQDALDILNRDFRMLNNDVNSVYPSFLPIAGDVEIEFAFAKTAPNGICFDGITRTVSNETHNGENGYAQVNAIVNGNDIYQGVWPHHKYLNIYVCEDLGSAAGYTYLPNGYASIDLEDMRYNSIFVRYDYLGSIEASDPFSSRVLTHEVGHWLNLSHIWGNDYVEQTCGDDGVPDTPITKGFTNCPSDPNTAKICDSNIVENFENYMDYSYCAKMFTQGQAIRMRAAIVSDVGGRDNIWTTTNLEEVGVLGSPAPLCAAQIDANLTLACEGSSIAYSVVGVSEPITAYSWTFQGGSPATSTLANPTITYNIPGVYDVALSITTATASKLITNTSYISIEASSILFPLPISEGFVNTLFPPQGWSINNGGNPITWQRSTKGTVPTAGSSAMLSFDAGENTTGDIDDLNAFAFSLNDYSSASLTFDVAYKRYDGYFFDKLEVLVSPECGMPYQVVYSKQGTDLATEPDGYGYSNPTIWRNETIDLTPFAGNSEVKVKFRGTSGWGNQIYIDNINIVGVSANFTASDNTICQGETVTYTNTATGATSWDWDFGVGATPATATGMGPHTVSYTTTGNKIVSLSLDGGNTSTTQVVLVNSLPSVTMDDFPTPCINYAPITLTQGNPSGGTYSGIGVSGSQFNPTTAGIGSQMITYTYTSPSTNCSDSITKQITVDGCLGINVEDPSSLTISPNPTAGAVTISSLYSINEIVVLDNVGRVVVVLNPNNSNFVDIDLSNLSSGIYMVLTNISGLTKTNKLIVE